MSDMLEIFLSGLSIFLIKQPMKSICGKVDACITIWTILCVVCSTNTHGYKLPWISSGRQRHRSRYSSSLEVEQRNWKKKNRKLHIICVKANLDLEIRTYLAFSSSIAFNLDLLLSNIDAKTIFSRSNVEFCDSRVELCDDIVMYRSVAILSFSLATASCRCASTAQKTTELNWRIGRFYFHDRKGMIIT